MLSIYNFLKVKLCYRTYWKQWLAFLAICFLVFACSDDSSDNNSGQLELAGTYISISGDECGVALEFECDNTLTITSTQFSATDLDPSTGCQSGPTRNFGGYEITPSESNTIEGEFLSTAIDGIFSFNRSSGIINLYFDESGCLITETWQKE